MIRQWKFFCAQLRYSIATESSCCHGRRRAAAATAAVSLESSDGRSIKLEFKLGLGFGKDPSIWPSTINLATAIWAFVRRRCQMAIGGDFLGKLAKG